jgi:hypothetical protein
VSGTVKSAVKERASGGRPSRWKAFLAALFIGFAAFVTAYKLMRG